MNSSFFFRMMAIVAISSLFFACKNKNNKTAVTAEQPPIAVCPEPTVREVNMENGPMDVVYFVFKGYDARMVMPEAWMDNVTITKSPENEDGASAEYIANFTGDEKKTEFLGAIYIFTKPQWEAVSPDWKGIYTKVGEVGGNLYYYKSNQSNPYGNETEIGKAFDSHFITMPKASKVFVIEKLFPYTVKLDKNSWGVSPTEEGGFKAQNDEGISITLGTSTGSGRGLKSLDDVKNKIIKTDKTAKILSEPVKIGGFDAVCYESNAMNNMEYACVAYIQTGKEDFKMLLAGGKKSQENQIKDTFKKACSDFQRKFS